MADVQQAVRRLSIQATTSGVTDATRQLNDLARAQGGVAVASATTEKATESLDRKFASIEKRYISSVRAQADFEKTQRMVNAAVAQNPALQERANIILLAARERHDQLTRSQKAMSAATSELGNQMQAAVSSFGTAGAALAAMGPAGIAAAAALGLLSVGFKQAADAALALADRGGKLKDFAETTGFTVVQLQALEKAGAQVGVSSESVTRGLERFSVAMDDVKKGTGPVFESILEINPALAQQMKQVGSLTEAWDVFAKAIKQSDLEQSNKLARSVFGRSGVEITRLARSNADAGGIGGLTNQLKEVDRITAAQAERWDELGDKIAENMKAAKQNVAAVFTEPVLNALLTFSSGFLELSRVARSFTMSDEMKLMFKPMSAAASTLGAVGSGVMGAVGSGVSIVSGWLGKSSAPAPSGGASFESRWGDTSTGPAVGIDTARLEQQKRSLAQLVAEQERWAAAMGAAVTPAQQLKLSLDKVRLAQLENKISAEQAAQASGVLKAQFESSQFSAYVGALGQAVSVEEQVKAKRLQLNDAMRQGAKLSEEQIAFQLQYTRESALGITQIKAAADAERVRADTLLMGRESAVAYEIVQTKINEARLKGAPLTAREIADLTQEAVAYAKVKVEAERYEEAIRFAKDSAQQFTSTLVQGLLSGKSLMESLSAAAKQLASSLANSAINDLFNGNFVGAAVKGAAAIGAALFGSATEQDKSLEEAKKRWKEMADQVEAFNRAAEGFDLGPLTGELNALQSSLMQLSLAALEAREFGELRRLQDQFNRGAVRIVDEFKRGNEVLSPFTEALRDLNGEARGLQESLEAIGLDALAAEIDATLPGLVQALRDQFSTDMTDRLNRSINSSRGQDYLNEVADALADLGKNLADAALLGSDALAALADQEFILRAQAIVDAADLTGSAFDELITKFPQLRDAVHEDAEERTRILQEALEAQKRQALDYKQYIDQLLGGPDAALSPIDRLNTTEQAYREQLALARSGDTTAQGSLTGYFDRFREAAASFYGTAGADYQRIVAGGVGDLRGLAGLLSPGVNLAASDGIVTGGADSASPSDNAAPWGDLSALREELVALREEVKGLRADANQRLDTSNQVAVTAHIESKQVLSSIDENLEEIRIGDLLESARPAA